MKIVGLYYIAAALLFFVFDEHQVAVAQPQPDRARRDRVYGILVTLASIAFVSGLLYLVRAVPGESRLLHFVLPGVLLVAFLTAAEWRDAPAEPWTRRVRRLSGLVGPFALGLAVPLAVFLYPYVASDSVGALLQGVFIEPTKRLHFAVGPPLPLRTLPMALPWLLVLVPLSSSATTTRARWEQLPKQVPVVAFTLILALVAAAAVRGGKPYVAVWMSVCYVAPCTVIAGLLLLSHQTGPLRPRKVVSEQVWLLLCMTAMCSLIQVPYAKWRYILYFAPLAILALLAVVATRPSGPGPRPAIVAGFFLAYAVAAVNPGHVTVLGDYLSPETWPRVLLAIPRGGLKVTAIGAARYERVVHSAALAQQSRRVHVRGA